jgi:hypothetical protein
MAVVAGMGLLFGGGVGSGAGIARAEEPASLDAVREARLSLPAMTGVLVGIQLGVIAAFGREDAWRDEGHVFEDGFSTPPKPDDDVWVFNYMLHPWVGAEYYLVARNRDCGIWRSFLYSAALSTCYEYLVENMVQHPSSNDLILTPVGGALIGECRYALKRRLAGRPASDWRVRWSRALLDPMDVTLGGYPDGRMHVMMNFKAPF